MQGYFNIKGYGEFDNNARAIAGATRGTIFAAADNYQDAAQLKQLISDNWVRPEFGPRPRTIWP
jgi:hypothetical protein